MAIEKRLIPKLLDDRFTKGRLSNQTTWRPCTESASDTTVVPRTRCQARSTDPNSDAKLSERWESRLSAQRTPVTLRARALSELKWHEVNTPALARAVTILEEGLKLKPADPSILNDLAVANIELAERNQQLELMLRALDLVERALDRDSTRLAARFNRALIMERLYQVESAHAAWIQYLALDSTSAWGVEAREHAAALAQFADAEEWNLATLEAAPDSARRWVERSPQAVRDTVWAGLLPQWGRAVIEGDDRRATELLKLATKIAQEFEGLDRDQTVPMALAAITSASLQQRQELARAHIAFGAGFTQVQTGGFKQSVPLLENARAALSRGNSSAARWATYYLAGAHLRLGRYALAERILRELQAQVTDKEPALIGKVLWQRGVAQLRQGNYEMATRRYREAAPHIERAGEQENLGAISYLTSESLVLAGQSEAGRSEAYHGLQLLWPFRPSRHLNNQLENVAALARADGMPYAALALMDEAIHVARRSGQADRLALAFRARALDLIHLGKTAEARSELTQALRWADSVQEGSGRDRARADVTLVVAELELSTDPQAALAKLSSVVAAYRDLNLDFVLADALHKTARAALASHLPAEARLHLDQAIVHIEKQQALFQTAEARAKLYETVETVFDAVIELELDRDSAAAFEYLERSRTAARRLGETQSQARSSLLKRVSAALPSDMLLVEYAVLADEIAVWVVSKKGSTLHRLRVPRDSLALLVDRFSEERANIGDEAGLARTALYDLLIRKVLLKHETEGIRKLAIVPDRELHSIAFSALRDSATNQYLIQQYPVHTLPSAAYLVDAVPAHGGLASERALVVGNPVIDAAAGLPLPPLPKAEEEADSIAGIYELSERLVRGDARRDRVLELLPRQAIFHFAGHAVFNSEQPELSYLVLAGDANQSGLLYAREIGNLRLSKLKLVVLSACSTLNPRTTRVGVVAGLAHSFLRAGAPAIVSSIWDVDDAAAAELLVEFHKNFKKSGDAAEALRAAQITALKSNRPERRAIENWAAFIYTGI